MDIKITAGKIGKVINGETINFYEPAYFSSKSLMKKNSVKVFVSYAHEDEFYKDELNRHLGALKRNGRIEVWNDRQIISGQEWDNAIKEELNSADIILLLISVHFIASDYIWNTELARAIERHRSRTCIVVPIFCSACDHAGLPFSALQGLPRDARPISTFQSSDEAYLDIINGLKQVLDGMLKDPGLEKDISEITL